MNKDAQSQQASSCNHNDTIEQLRTEVQFQKEAFQEAKNFYENSLAKNTHIFNWSITLLLGVVTIIGTILPIYRQYRNDKQQTEIKKEMEKAMKNNIKQVKEDIEKLQTKTKKDINTWTEKLQTKTQNSEYLLKGISRFTKGDIKKETGEQKTAAQKPEEANTQYIYAIENYIISLNYYIKIADDATYISNVSQTIKNIKHLMKKIDTFDNNRKPSSVSAYLKENKEKRKEYRTEYPIKISYYINKYHITADNIPQEFDAIQTSIQRMLQEK